MKYSSVELTVSKEQAHKRIVSRVDGLSVKDEKTRYVYRSPSGFQIATLSEVRGGANAAKSRLRYRTTLISPAVAHAKRKARNIRQAVDEFVVK